MPASRSIAARATVLGPHEVEVDGKNLTAKHILVATGSWPVLPPIPGHRASRSPRTRPSTSSACRSARSWSAAATSRSSSPRSSTAWACKTTLTYRGKRLLRGFDAELGDAHGRGDGREGRGHLLRLRARRDSQSRTTDLEIDFTDGSMRETDLVMFATGRRPNTAKLGLEAAGVKLAADGAVIVDKYSKTHRRLDPCRSATSPTASTSRRSPPPRRCGSRARCSAASRPPVDHDERADRGVRQPQRRHRRPVGGEGARALRRGRHLQGLVPLAQAHHDARRKSAPS